MTASAFTLASGGAALVLPTTSWVSATLPPPPPVSPPTARSCSATLAHAAQALLLAKRAANRRGRTVENLRQYVGAFIRGREALTVDAVTVGQVEEWLGARHKTPGGRATGIGRLSALFSFSIRRGWITDNPCDRIERVAVENPPPSILTPDQVARLFDYLRRREPWSVAWFALATFAGLRPSECDLIRWEHVDLDRAVVVVDSAASKTRRRRLVPLMPAAAAWLRYARDHGGGRLEMSHATRRRVLRRVRNALGLATWPQDVLRHTAATYWLAETEDVARVSRYLGNSPGVLLRSYANLVSREDAARFWSLRPPA